MIVGEQKPIGEIKDMIACYDHILILGCGTCVKTCFAGGEDEVSMLASALRLAFGKDGKGVEINELTIERQCEDEFLGEAAQHISRCEAVLSLACGAGVQMVADRYSKSPVLPGINTTFIGVLEKQGVFSEYCTGCGNCILSFFAGICPVSRCSKKLLNGPCGGSSEGMCEVNSDIACAWQVIINRFKDQDRLKELMSYVPPRDWRTSYAGGPRKLVREDHMV